MLPRAPNRALGAAVVYRHLLQNAPDRVQARRQTVGAGKLNSALRGGVVGARKEPPCFRDWRHKKAPCYLRQMCRQSERDIPTRPGLHRRAGIFRGLRPVRPLLSAVSDAGAGNGQGRPEVVTLLNALRERRETLPWEMDECARKFDYRYEDDAKGRARTGTLPLPPGDEAVGRPRAAHSPTKGTSNLGRTARIPCGPPRPRSCESPV